MHKYWDFYIKSLHPLGMNEDLSLNYLYNNLRIYMGDPKKYFGMMSIHCI